MKFVRFELWAASQFDQVLPFRIWGYAICRRLKLLSGIQASRANERGAGRGSADKMSGAADLGSGSCESLGMCFHSAALRLPEQFAKIGK